MSNLFSIFQKYHAIVFFDTETTGLYAKYKDRHSYPHKLVDAIKVYKLQNIVKNSHRAIDDVMALFEVFKAMNKERSNLLTYVNKFGFNPKYGIKGQRINKVKYFPQS